VPEADTAQLPTSKDFVDDAGRVEERLSSTEREFVNGIDGDIVSDVENARSFIALEAIHVFWPGRLSAADGTVINRMRPRIASLKLQPGFQASFERKSQRIVCTRTDIPLDVDRPERISAGIIRIEGAHAIAVNRIERNRFSA
jgi:hypothetical protein